MDDQLTTLRSITSGNIIDCLDGSSWRATPLRTKGTLRGWRVGDPLRVEQRGAADMWSHNLINMRDGSKVGVLPSAGDLTENSTAMFARRFGRGAEE